jgi:hypothetical protein
MYGRASLTCDNASPVFPATRHFSSIWPCSTSAARPRTPAREAPGTPAARSVHRRGQERAAPARLRLIGYVRVSTREQGTNGHGLDAQRSAIERYCRANG